MPERELGAITWKHIVVLIVSLATVVLWGLDTIINSFTGKPGITALIPVVIFFGLGLMDKKDFKNLSWDVLMLLGGGLVMGHTIGDSGLLQIIADAIHNAVHGQPTWVVFTAFAFLLWFFGNFVSHTVAAIIVLPVVAQVGCELADTCQEGHMRLLVMGAVMIDSCAMALPVSSFPNAQVFSETDRLGKQFITTFDFVKTGFLIGIFEFALLISLGYGLGIAFNL